MTPGPRKAALLVANLDSETASRLSLQLSDAEVERLKSEVSRLASRPGSVEEIDSTFDEVVKAYWRNPPPYDLRKMLRASGIPDEEVERIISTIETSKQMNPMGDRSKSTTKQLDETEIQAFVNTLGQKPPQAAAAVLLSLDVGSAAEILERLPEETRMPIIRHAASLDLARIAAILSLVQRSTERSILEGLEEANPEIVEQIRRLMFTFECMMRVDDRGVQDVLKIIDSSQLSLALKTAASELKEKFFKNMSTRAVELVKEEMEFMGPVRLADVESAQQAIVDVVQRLKDEGRLSIDDPEGRVSVEARVAEEKKRVASFVAENKKRISYFVSRDSKVAVSMLKRWLAE